MTARDRMLLKLDKDMHHVKKTLERIDAKASTYPLNAKCSTCGREKFYSHEHFRKHTQTCTKDGRRAWGIRTKRSHTEADRLFK